MADLRKLGSTSNVFRFKLTKSSDGTAFTGATFSSIGLIISTICDNEATATAYTAAGSTIETITTLGAFAAPTATKCRFREVDATNHPGLYEFQFADARFAVATAKKLVITVSGITDLFSCDYEIQFSEVPADTTKVSGATQTARDIGASVIVETNNDKTGYSLSTAASTAIGDGFLAHVLTKGTAGTIERALWQISKTQVALEAVVVADAGNTATTFLTDIAIDDYSGQVAYFVSGNLVGQARPIVSVSSGTLTVERAFTETPADDDEFLILPTLTQLVAWVQSGLATALALATVDSIVDEILVDTGTTLPAQIAGISGGGGGSATVENQEAILAALQGVEVVQVASPNVLGNLVLTQGDDYDGVANPRASWTVSTDYTDGWTVAFTIRDADDLVIYTTSGTVVSSTVVAVTIAAPTGLTMMGCPGQWQGKFDVELTHSTGKKKTIALGTVYINEDQTR